MLFAVLLFLPELQEERGTTLHSDKNLAVSHFSFQKSLSQKRRDTHTLSSMSVSVRISCLTADRNYLLSVSSIDE